MPFEIIRNDITTMSVDAIVNAANSALQMGGGVCGAIFSAAGAKNMQAACDKIGGCGVGKAVLTDGFDLPAKFVIHTVGPIWQGGNHYEAQQLNDCYSNSLELARQNKCTSLAFPLISSGIYGYPRDQALQIAISAIGKFLLQYEMQVYLVVYDPKTFAQSERLFSAIMLTGQPIIMQTAKVRHCIIQQSVQQSASSGHVSLLKKNGKKKSTQTSNTVVKRIGTKPGIGTHVMGLPF